MATTGQLYETEITDIKGATAEQVAALLDGVASQGTAYVVVQAGDWSEAEAFIASQLAEHTKGYTIGHVYF